MTLCPCYVYTQTHMFFIHKVLEQVLLTVLVPFPNSSMRTNELPVLLLIAWAIWRIKTQMVAVYCTLLLYLCLCVYVR